MKNTRTVSKGRLREGQPLSMRASGRPTGKRPFNAGIEGSKELNYLHKALEALGAANDAAHRYESVMRHIRSIKESSQWNRETNPYAKAAFDAVFNLIDSSYIDLDQAEDDMMEEEYRAENNEMFQNVLQGIYHALEQFIPQVNEIFGPDGLDIIFGDNLYDLSI